MPERIDFVWTNARVTDCRTMLRRMPDTQLNYSGALTACDIEAALVQGADCAARPSHCACKALPTELAGTQLTLLNLLN